MFIYNTNRMKRKIYSTLAVFTLLLFASCACTKSDRRSERKITQSSKIKYFKNVNIEGCYNVYFEQADSASIRFEGSEKAIQQLRITCDGNTLDIKRKEKDKWLNFCNQEDVDIYITSPDLVSVYLKGTGEFEVHKRLDTDTLSVSLMGTGDIDIKDLICDKVKVNLKGTGDINIKNVITSQAFISLLGTGDIKVHFEKCQWAHCSLQGTGDIDVSGTVNTYKEKIQGTGSIDTDELHILSK